jgi:hypothetical protein
MQYHDEARNCGGDCGVRSGRGRADRVSHGSRRGVAAGASGTRLGVRRDQQSAGQGERDRGLLAHAFAAEAVCGTAGGLFPVAGSGGRVRIECAADSGGIRRRVWAIVRDRVDRPLEAVQSRRDGADVDFESGERLPRRSRIRVAGAAASCAGVPVCARRAGGADLGSLDRHRGDGVTRAHLVAVAPGDRRQDRRRYRGARFEAVTN